ncbi:MAG: rRNA maturation RNase YbeY [Endomicrobia bacterium]|nr:rRNA maturation RNase YbeY [Endomicrobiia bacterium]
MSINIFYKVQDEIIPVFKLKKVLKEITNLLFKNKQIRKKLNLNFVFVNNFDIKKLNKEFLNRKFATDVLCFKYDEFSADIIVSIPQVINNAKIYKTTPVKELLFVVIHGILHFKGMQDNTTQQRKKMFNIAKKMISQLNTKII